MAKAISTIERTRVATPLVPSLAQLVSGYDITRVCVRMLLLTYGVSAVSPGAYVCNSMFSLPATLGAFCEGTSSGNEVHSAILMKFGGYADLLN
jgi:hypothetical protein